MGIQIPCQRILLDGERLYLLRIRLDIELDTIGDVSFDKVFLCRKNHFGGDR